MVKVSFLTVLAQKDPRKDIESLVSQQQDPETVFTVRRQQQQQQQTRLWCCFFFVGLALVVSGVVVGGAYLYHLYESEVEDVLVCEMTYTEELELELEAPLRLIQQNVIFQNDEVELIKVPVPEFQGSDPAGILHDFNMRLTAYLDITLNTCYIIALNTSVVMPPRDFHDFLVNLKSGMYLPQTYLVHEEMMVTEKLERDVDLGHYINSLCQSRDVYRLQRRDAVLGMQKRQARRCHTLRHFENKFVVETVICEP